MKHSDTELGVMKIQDLFVSEWRQILDLMLKNPLYCWQNDYIHIALQQVKIVLDEYPMHPSLELTGKMDASDTGYDVMNNESAEWIHYDVVRDGVIARVCLKDNSLFKYCYLGANLVLSPYENRDVGVKPLMAESIQRNYVEAEDENWMLVAIRQIEQTYCKKV